MPVPLTPSDLLIFLFSPTRFLIERFSDPKPIRIWNWVFRAILCVWIVGLLFGRTGEVVRQWPYHLGYVALWLFPFSRVNELTIGFYKDAVQRFKGPPNRSKIVPAERLTLLVTAYFEIAAQFGILYFCALPSGCFSSNFRSIIEAVYFSVVTITTAGYGNIHPQNSSAQIACMYELAVGFTVIAFALGSYLATSKPDA